MNRTRLLGLLLVATLPPLGCGSDNTTRIDQSPITPEQAAQIKAADDAVDQEERAGGRQNAAS